MSENENKQSFSSKIKGVFEKLKKIKNIRVIICIALIAVILLVYALVREYGDTVAEDGSTVEDNAQISDEDRLAGVLSQIKGAGNVSVFISYDGTSEIVYAYDSHKNTTVREDNSGGAKLISTVTEENSVPVFVTVNGVKTPVVTKEISPEILGVVIVAEGANDISVRLQLIKAAAAALNVSEKIIEIFIMK